MVNQEREPRELTIPEKAMVVFRVVISFQRWPRIPSTPDEWKAGNSQATPLLGEGDEIGKHFEVNNPS